MQTFKKISFSLCIGLTLGAVLFTGQAFAGAKPDEVHRLSEDLTPMGSERAGNAEGTIPEWTGGITEPPPGYSPGDHHPNPWPEDKPLYRITGSNYQEYADQLSPGQVATFEKYPDTYFMDVYQSRRSASFPQRIYDKTKEIAATARTVDNGYGVTGAINGIPFPIPKTGTRSSMTSAVVQANEFPVQNASRINVCASGPNRPGIPPL